MIENNKKTRNTLQKKIILETLEGVGSHPTIEDVYVEVKKTYPAISKNTIYRNLRQLAEDGVIRRVSLTGEPERYDKINTRHYHFQCKICGMMSDIEVEYFEGINEAARQNKGFQIDEHDVMFRGICPQCGEIC